MTDAATKHPYHLVDPSPWPVLGAFGALVTAVGLIMSMHGIGGGLITLIIGALLIALTMVVWWRDVIREAHYENQHSAVTQLGLRFGMALFIASEVMFFAAWFWAFFDASIFADEVKQVEGQWTAVRRTMKNVQNGHRTEVTSSQVQYNVGLEDSLFSERYLSNPPARWVQ